MNILHLKYAVEIANTKSISKAAENLYMGQPNLSRAMKELEESLGISIFKRTSKGITITPEGEEFLQYARRIVRQVDEVESMYKNGKIEKKTFSVCVPRASYVANAFTAFSSGLPTDTPIEIVYRETDSMGTIRSVVDEDTDLGVIRYQLSFDRYFRSLFSEKKLSAETITEFSYQLLMSKHHPLAEKPDIRPSELTDYIEITHADSYVPSLPLIDVKKAELSEHVDKRIFVYERASQYELLERVPNTFMWVSPVSQALLDKYELVQKKCASNKKVYKDVLIYRRGYSFTSLDRAFVESLNAASAELGK